MNRDIYLWLSSAIVAASIAVSVVDVHEGSLLDTVRVAEVHVGARVPGQDAEPVAGAAAGQPAGPVAERDGDNAEPAVFATADLPEDLSADMSEVRLANGSDLSTIEPAYELADANAASAEPFARAEDEDEDEDLATAPVTASVASAISEDGGETDPDSAPVRGADQAFAPPPEMMTDVAAPVRVGEVEVPGSISASTATPAPSDASEADPEAATTAALRTALAVTAPDRAHARRPRAASHWTRRIGEDIDKELKCLALNIYWEARSEPTLGRFAVAAVTLNRVSHKGFPDTICGVVHQGEERGLHRCQFSWVCDGKPKRPGNAKAWREAEHIAHTMLFLDLPDPTDGALWYHADYVSPGWAKAMARVTQIGRHIYYRGVIRTVSGERAAG